MLHIQDNVRQEIIKLLPSSIISDIACFVLYDAHPRDNKTIDITICTSNGEVKEFYQRDLVLSLNLDCMSNPTDIKIMRNKYCELFYLVSTEDELVIVSSKNQLNIHKKLNNIDRYDINDTYCSGKAFLSVVRKDDAVPMVFDDNFELLENQNISSSENADDSLPILTELKRKLTEARYTTKCNEKTYSQYLALRQKVLLQNAQNVLPNSSDSLFNNDLRHITAGIKLKTQKPWVKCCNKKLLIVMDALNESNESLQNIHILLNTEATSSLVYQTKTFAAQNTPPYWNEETSILKSNRQYAIVALMDLEEVELNITNRIELNGCISYNLLGKEYLLPFDDVIISALDSMGDEFDVLSNAGIDNEKTMLAIIASTVKTDLILRLITDELQTSIQDLLCTHLQMEKLGDNNVILYRKSPYHVLNGTMMVFGAKISQHAVAVSVFTRTPSQVLALLHYIYDAVPAKIIATTPNYRISSDLDQFSQYNEEITEQSKTTNYIDYATSIINRSTQILEYLDTSMIKMSESKNQHVKNKVGSHIDLFAGGVDNFKEFRRNILEEARKGTDSLIDNLVDTDSDVTIVD